MKLFNYKSRFSVNSLYGYYSDNKGLDAFFKTEDQSYSLRLGKNTNISELMHSARSFCRDFVCL